MSEWYNEWLKAEDLGQAYDMAMAEVERLRGELKDAEEHHHAHHMGTDEI